MYREYFEEKIKPHIDGKFIEYMGLADLEAKNELLGNSLAMLSPIKWDEPFDLVMVEAMACGTPVLSLPGGSVCGRSYATESRVTYVAPFGSWRSTPRTLTSAPAPCVSMLNRISRSTGWLHDTHHCMRRFGRGLSSRRAVRKQDTKLVTLEGRESAGCKYELIRTGIVFEAAF